MSAAACQPTAPGCASSASAAPSARRARAASARKRTSSAATKHGDDQSPTASVRIVKRRSALPTPTPTPTTRPTPNQAVNGQHSELAITSHHEAAHLVVGARLGVPCGSISVDEDGDSRGRVYVFSYPLDAVSARENMTMLAAGKAAERRLTGDASRELANSDFHSAVKLAWRVVGLEGDAERVKSLLDEAERVAELLVAQHWADIAEMARHVQVVQAIVERHRANHKAERQRARKSPSPNTNLQPEKLQ
ncbi:MAG: hypothetical protein U0575_07415 [Phycisphaerales bacterium]